MTRFTGEENSKKNEQNEIDNLYEPESFENNPLLKSLINKRESEALKKKEGTEKKNFEPIL